MNEEGDNINPGPCYETKYPDVDTLDHSIYFKTDRETIFIYWESTFCSYGVISKLIDFTENTNTYEQKWDVSEETKWTDIVGQKIVDFKIDWKETGILDLNRNYHFVTLYPQIFQIKFGNEKMIYITASELKKGEDEYHSMMDNLLVISNINTLIKLESIERIQIEESKNSSNTNPSSS
ncbi:hypothetical protein ACFQ48_10155 [Hymenobacter caeli]|uniref:Uncharacterized protein n=1 Tax=Hymenobacter caeli TaxID=2735894 RepID=A0ABX2FTJ7_9BACT|nr:hypothetical protein [Hymenobacter caeli]NRT19794.1 hypothetical protein [Hymenobacter caeli]